MREEKKIWLSAGFEMIALLNFPTRSLKRKGPWLRAQRAHNYYVVRSTNSHNFISMPSCRPFSESQNKLKKLRCLFGSCAAHARSNILSIHGGYSNHSTHRVRIKLRLAHWNNYIRRRVLYVQSPAGSHIIIYASPFKGTHNIE